MQDEPKNISLAAVEMRGVNHVCRNREIVVEEFGAQRCWRRCRRPSPPPEHRLRLARREPLEHSGLIAQIEFTCVMVTSSTSARKTAPAPSRPCRDGRRRPSCPQFKRDPIGRLLPRDREIAGHHFLGRALNVVFGFSQVFPRLAGVADQEIDSVGRNTRVDAHHGLADLRSTPASSLPLPSHSTGPPDLRERRIDQSHRPAPPVASTKSSRIRLQDLCMPSTYPARDPSRAGIAIAEIERLLQPSLDARHGAGDLARHESLAMDRALG
jgi:hypothetical protein